MSVCVLPLILDEHRLYPWISYSYGLLEREKQGQGLSARVRERLVCVSLLKKKWFVIEES